MQVQVPITKHPLAAGDSNPFARSHLNDKTLEVINTGREYPRCVQMLIRKFVIHLSHAACEAGKAVLALDVEMYGAGGSVRPKKR